jgi:hypothetical protein
VSVSVSVRYLLLPFRRGVEESLIEKLDWLEERENFKEISRNREYLFWGCLVRQVRITPVRVARINTEGIIGGKREYKIAVTSDDQGYEPILGDELQEAPIGDRCKMH